MVQTQRAEPGAVLFLHMPKLVMAFSGCCQILAFANEGHMFPLKEGLANGPEMSLSLDEASHSFTVPSFESRRR